MSLPQAILITAILSTLLPVVAVYLRGGSRRIVPAVTVLAAISLSFHLTMILRVVEGGALSEPNAWVRALIGSAMPVLLAGYVYSICFGRDRPEESLQNSRRTFILLSLIGMVFLTQVKNPLFIRSYDWTDGRGTIYLGFIGKAFISYLLIGIVFIGHNLERTYRVSTTDGRFRMRLALLGFFGMLGFFTFILATGLLYSSIGMGKLVAAGLPVIFASLVIAHGYLRRAIADVSAPVSREIVYSSFTALAAGLFVISIGLAAQVATWTNWSPDEVLIVTLAFVAILGAALLLFSNRFQRMVRRFVDRNFYVNRYDYRAQWSKITAAVENTGNSEDLLDGIVAFLQEVFATDAITIALRDEVTGAIRPSRGVGREVPEAVMLPDAPLRRYLTQEHKAVLLDRKPHDFTYIAIYAEDGAWLDATASQVVAPVFEDEQLVGTIGLARADRHDPFTYEDVALLDSISAHVASALRAMRLACELAEVREAELMSQWSSMILHDLKNYLAPLRMAAANLIEYKDDPEVTETCARDIERVAERMGRLVHTLAELRQNPQLGQVRIDPNQLVEETLSAMQIERNTGICLDLELKAQLACMGDRGLLQRVLENMMTNALEAMDGDGTLTITTADLQSNGCPRVQIGIADTGSGIPAEFLRDRLFRPFATTKKSGLGLGLYQCRAIIRAHGGDLSVVSRNGRGAQFQIALDAAVPAVVDGDAL